jgi:50S ribosome-binding GTPase
MMDDELSHRTHQLLAEAAHLYRGDGPAAALLHENLERLTEPLRLAVIGPARVGKSTLINALVGEDVAPVKVTDETYLITVYGDGPQPRAQLYANSGAPYDVAMIPAASGLRLSLGTHHQPAYDDGAGSTPDNPRRARIEWPSRMLRRVQLTDTPGLLPDAEGRQLAQRIFREADAVLYLTQHLGEADLRFLQASRATRGPSAFPVQVMVVLSRADETAAGRIDALLTAKQVARRRRREPRVAALCQDVLAVSPLIGHTGRTLRDDEFRAIATLAALPRADSEPHLLSTDRFTATDSLQPVTVEQRALLLQRLGLGGVRLAITLARTGDNSCAALAERLQEHSGLKNLQATVAELFTARRAALQARSALTALDHVLRTKPLPPPHDLAAELELLVAGAHQFRELRLLSAMRSGQVTLQPESALEAKRLLGGSGTSVGERLSMPAEATADDIWQQAQAAAARWQDQTHRAGQTAAQRRAAETVLRSCDAILTWLEQPDSSALYDG